MTKYAALDVSIEKTAICVVDEDGRKIVEGKVPTDPATITAWLADKVGEVARVGMETGPLAVWLWNELTMRSLPIVCLDARHANAALSMMPNKTDRHDAAGLAQIVRTGWYKQVRIKSHGAYVVRALLSARDILAGIRGRIENEIRGLLKTFGVMFGKKAGGFTRRAGEIVTGELAAAPEIKMVVELLLQARRSILERLKSLDAAVRAAARRNAMARLFMTAPGVGAMTALSVASVFDDASRFSRSSSAGAYLGLTPRRYESGEVSRNGHISKRGNKLTRTHLYEAANVILTRQIAFSSLKAWGLRIAKAGGFKKAKAAVARKLTVILHAMWKTASPSGSLPPWPDTGSALPRQRTRPRWDAGADEAAPGSAVALRTAHTTSTRPFQRQHAATLAVDPGENPEPSECHAANDGALTGAIRELPGTRPKDCQLVSDLTCVDIGALCGPGAQLEPLRELRASDNDISLTQHPRYPMASAYETARGSQRFVSAAENVCACCSPRYSEVWNHTDPRRETLFLVVSSSTDSLIPNSM